MTDPNPKPAREIIGYMKSKPGEDDLTMLINEYPDGGFKWTFLDYEPDDKENYTKIFIYGQSMLAAYAKLTSERDELERKYIELNVASNELLFNCEKLEAKLAVAREALEKVERGALEMAEYFQSMPKYVDGHEEPNAHTAFGNFSLCADLARQALKKLEGE